MAPNSRESPTSVKRRRSLISSSLTPTTELTSLATMVAGPPENILLNSNDRIMATSWLPSFTQPWVGAWTRISGPIDQKICERIRSGQSKRSMRRKSTCGISMAQTGQPPTSTHCETSTRCIKRDCSVDLASPIIMAWGVAQIYEICKANNWIQPCVYQGIYNSIHRAVEPGLFPCLRHFGMGSYAYNPLGGDFFTGAFTKDAGSTKDRASTQRNGTKYVSRQILERCLVGSLGRCAAGSGKAWVDTGGGGFEMDDTSLVAGQRVSSCNPHRSE